MRHCMQAAFGGRRIVVFSGGAAKGEDAVYDDARAIRDGGGNGSIIGRNTFQRSREDALAMLGKLVEIYKGAGLIKAEESAANQGIPFRRGDLACSAAEAETGITSSNVSLNPEPRRGMFGAVFVIVVVALMGYLSFAALQGEHGLLSLFRVEAQETRLRGELAGLQAERATISNKTRRLSTEHLDLDLLDEQARKVLGLGRPDEIIIR